MESQLQRFFGLNDSVPEYILSNLENLPNNRGYIWKDVWCFGKRPAESDVVHLTEPKRGFVYIHEIHKDKHLIFTKQGREAPQLVQTIRRTKLLS